MNITRLAIDNNRVTLVLLFAICLSGISAFINLPRAYDPGFIVRAAQIITYFPGASPARVEELVSSRLEDVVKEIPELDFVTSESRTGVSIVMVTLKANYTDLRPIWDRLRRKVDEVKRELPEGVSGPFVNDEFGDVFGIVLAITGDGFSYTELQDYAEDIQDELLRLPDAAKVEIHGEQEERIFVEYDNARLAELGLSPNQLSQSLSSRNIVSTGGSFNLDTERISLEPSGNYNSVEDIKRTIIHIPNSESIVYLQDIADVSRTYIDPPSSQVRASGQPALIVSVSMREGGNNVNLGEQVNNRIQELFSNYPHGIEFEVINFSPTEVDDKVKEFSINLLQAVAVVTAVVLLLLGLRTGLVVSTLIPSTMLFSLLLMYYLDIGLDQISLAALIIALGMLVDNGIVMSENIMVQMESGKSPLESALSSAEELKVPLLTASATTSAAFLPIFLAESDVGEFTASLFKVVSITLLCSWIISMTLIPLLCITFLKVKHKASGFDTPFYRGYRSVLTGLIHHRTLTLTAVVILFASALYSTQYLPNIFFPPSDRTYFKLELELPFGTNLNTTQQVVTDIEQYMEAELKTSEQNPEGIINWASYVGEAGPRFVLSHNPKPSSPNYALLVINATSSEVIDELMGKLYRFAFNHFPDLDAKVRRIENGPSVANPVEIRLSGRNQENLFEHVARLKAHMASIPGMTNITDNWGQRIKKLIVNIDQQRALRSGLTSNDIAVSLQTGLSGTEMTEFREGEDIIPVELRSHAASQLNLSQIYGLSVYSQSTGQSVPITQVADIKIAWEPGKVLRRNGLKTITVGAQLADGKTASEMFAQITPWLEQQPWIAGEKFDLGGELESSGKANQSIADKLPIAGFIILILLVSQFNSIRKSTLVLTTIPLGFIGVVFGLLLGQSFFGFMTLLGIISLAGIVINNAIVLLERIQLEEKENQRDPFSAIIHAAQQRLRPILVTTITTVLGMLPLYLGGGEMWEPMAIAIMAGLAFSTLLTLGVVPVLYAVLFRVKA